MMPKTNMPLMSTKTRASVASELKSGIECKMGEFLNSIFNAITDGITVIDRDFNILYINRSLAHFYGYEKAEDVIGKKCFAAFRGNKKQCKFCPTTNIFETGKPEHEFLAAEDFHGNEIHWEIYFYPIYNEKGEIESVVEYSRNITREKLLEKRAEESERKLGDIISASRDVVAEFNLDMEMTFVSPNIEEFSGYSEEEVLSADSFLDFCTPESQKLLVKYFMARISGEPVPNQYEVEFIHKNGEIIPVEATVSLRMKGDEIAGSVATIRDIRQRKKAEEALRKSEELLRGFMDSATEGFVLFDSQLNLLDVNKTALKIFNMSKKEVIGKNIVDIVPDIKETGRYDEHMKVIKTGKPSIAEDLVPHPKFGDVHLNVKSFKVGEGLGLIVTDITEQKRAEEALFESEKRYRTLFEKSPMSITLVDNKGVISDCNKATEKLIGYTKKEIVGKNLDELLTIKPQDLKKLYGKRRKLSEKRGIKPYELEIIRKDGESRWISISSSIITKGNEIIGFQGISTDITERKKAERALQESEELYRTLIETSPDAIVLTDLDTNIIMTNPAGAKDLGYDSPEELVGKSAFDLMAPEDLPRIMKNVEEMFEKGKVRNAEFNFIKKDGSRVPIEFNATLLKDEKGEPTSFVGISRNLTQRKKAEEQIRVANERLQYLLSSTSAVIYTAKTKGDYGATFISDNVTKMVGFKPDNFLKKSNFWADHIHPDDKKRTLKEVNRLYKTGNFTYEYRFKCKDGKYIWVRDEMELIKDKDGKPIEIVGYWIDISDRMQTEEKLRKSEERYRTFLENFHGIAYRAGGGWTPTLFQGAVEQITGYTPHEMIFGKPSWDKVIHPEDLPNIFTKDEKKLHTKLNYSYVREYRIIRKDGQIRWIREFIKSVSLNPFILEGAIYDITERKAAEDALQQSQEKYSNLFHQSNDPIILHNLKGKILEVNKRALDIFGYSEKELLDLNISNLHPEEALKKSKNAFRKIEKKGYVSFEIKLKRKVVRHSQQRSLQACLKWAVKRLSRVSYAISASAREPRMH